MAQTGKLPVIFEDNHLIVLNKRPGEVVHSNYKGLTALDTDVKDYLKVKYNKPGNVYLGVVHRIDRPTTGVLLYAKTSKAAARLSKQFQTKQIKKTYWAIVKDKPGKVSGTLHHYIVQNKRVKKAFISDKPKKDYKEAILHYRTIASSDNYHLIEVELETGRYHQIRCQLAHIGSPIKGDLKYGAPRSNKDGSISLHARSVTLEHPVKKEPLTITAPVPNDSLWKAMSNLTENSEL
jgi:23S rRNA pseudouridine1911/1915/1917 synthase